MISVFSRNDATKDSHFPLPTIYVHSVKVAFENRFEIETKQKYGNTKRTNCDPREVTGKRGGAINQGEQVFRIFAIVFKIRR